MRGGVRGIALGGIVLLLATAILISSAPDVRAPPLVPFDAFGLARDDTGTPLPVNSPIRTFIDGVDYSNLTVTSRADGSYSLQVVGNWYVGPTSETPSIKEGGDAGNSIMFAHGDLTTSAKVFREAGVWTTGAIQNIDLQWAAASAQPGLVKISSITTRPGDGQRQYAYVCNPTSTPVDLADYYLQKDVPGGFAGPTVSPVGTVGANGRTFIDLGSLTFLNGNGDAVKLVFRNPGGTDSSFGGADVIVDRVEFNATGGGGALTWEPGNTILSNALAPGIGEEIHRSSQCADTNSGSDFTVGPESGRAPVVEMLSPIGGERWSGGSTHDIRWNMTDVEDPNTALQATITLSNASGTDGYPTVIAANRAGTANPNLFAWPVPAVDSNTTRIRVCARDTGGLVGCGELTADFGIDNTAPTVLNTTPADGQRGVPLDQDVIILFSEPMNRASVEAAFSITPDPGPTTKAFQWSNTTFTDDTVTVPINILGVGSTYTVTIESTATDRSDPAQPLAAFIFTFSVATNQPPTVQITGPSRGQEFMGGRPIPIRWTMSDVETPVANLVVYINYTSSAGNGAIGGPLPGATTLTWTAPNIDASDVRIRITVLDQDGASANDVSEPFTIRRTTDVILYVGIGIAIVAALGILLFLFTRRRRKKSEAPPAPSRPPQAAPPAPRPATPPPVPPPPPATTKRCPQCGTVIDATDIECFRCGHHF